MATLSDVAARAGVSVSAVSRVLSNAPETRVSEETRDRIRRAARDLGYRPNSAGRALRSARSNVVALIVPDLMNALFVELVRGVEDAAIEQDYLVLMGRTEDIEPGGERAQKLLGEGRVDALLLQPGDKPLPLEALGGFADTRPVLLLNSVAEDGPGSATMPDEVGARVATRHLIDLGHERIAFANGIPESHTAARRGRGFRGEMAAAGLEVDESLITTYGYTPSDGERAAAQLLAATPRPTAVFVANVNAAVGLLAYARKAGVQVPRDLSVVALHDSWTAANTWPPLTTVTMPWYELGRSAFDEVHRRILGEQPAQIRVDEPSPRLVVRESAGQPS